MRRPLPPALVLATLLAGASLAGAAGAQTLSFPGNARQEREIVTPFSRYAMPVGPFADGVLPTTPFEGEVTEQAWRIDALALTTLQLLAPLRGQLVDTGFELLFECDTEDCGGFDFRHETRVIPPPDMYVDLGDFRFLAASRGDEAVSLLVSRTSDAGFVQVIRVGPAGNGAVATAGEPPIRGTPAQGDAGNSAVPVPVPDDFGAVLEAEGRVILSDLSFPTGSAQLAEGDYASLQRLADYLAANPSRTVALVGHTDSQGSLAANIALSKRRAGSVLERLVGSYGVPRQQLEAEGMGYLSPIATNLTAEGRAANRRVEVIVTSVE
jgi:outer membrane protein OmpA-like peptidoglycan-associated protein